MSDFDVNFGQYNIGTLAGGTIPLFHVPKNGGAITILEAYVASNGAGTLTAGQLVTGTGEITTGGNLTVDGTLGTLAFAGNGTLAAGSIIKFGISSGVVSPGTVGKWVAFKTTGSMVADAFLMVGYVTGR